MAVLFAKHVQLLGKVENRVLEASYLLNSPCLEDLLGIQMSLLRRLAIADVVHQLLHQLLRLGVDLSDCWVLLGVFHGS
jgi:hypothetical protein